MQNYTEDYRTVMLDDGQVHRLIGTVDGQDFNEEDVKNPSWNGVASNQNVLIGSAAIGKLQITFLKPFLNQGSWEDKVIVINDGTKIGETDEGEPIWEDKLIGTFYIGEAIWTNVGTIDVTAYDSLSKMDIDLTFEQTSGRLYDLLKFIELKTGVPLGMTQAEVEALPNSSEIISPYTENDMKTFRDMLSKLAQIVGGFAYAKRDGSFALKSFNNTSLVSIPITRRMRDAKYSDYQTRFDYLSYSDVKEGEVRYIGDQNGYGMDIGANPFLQYGLNEVRTRMANAIFDVVHIMTYTPYTVALLPSFCVLDLGDVVTFLDDYTGNDSSGAIMSMTWTYGKSVKIQCYGANPNLKKGKSSTDNSINGISSKSSQYTLVTHTYENAEAYNLANHQKSSPVVGISFATVRDGTLVKMLHEINLDLNVIGDEATVTAFYYLNDELQGYQPVGTFSEDGKQIIPLMYFLKSLPGGQAYDWEVVLRIDGGTGTIARGDVHAWLEGQGLVAVDEFAGTIHVEDYYEPAVLNKEIAPILDALTALDISNIDVDIPLSDLLNIAGLGEKELATLNDRNVSVQFAYVVYALVTDDGFAFVTDDGYTLTNSDGGWH